MSHAPLFPTPWTNDSDRLAHSPTGEVVPPGHTVMVPGATLRDYFAAKAMSACITACAHDNRGDLSYCEYVARVSYEMADAMLKARGGAA